MMVVRVTLVILSDSYQVHSNTKLLKKVVDIMSNEITVDFETGEIVEDEHMKYIDYVFDNMNKTDAKEAMKELIGMTKEVMKECEDSVKQMYENYMEIINFLEACGLLKK